MFYIYLTHLTSTMPFFGQVTSKPNQRTSLDLIGLLNTYRLKFCINFSYCSTVKQKPTESDPGFSSSDPDPKHWCEIRYSLESRPSPRRGHLPECRATGQSALAGQCSCRGCASGTRAGWGWGCGSRPSTAQTGPKDRQNFSSLPDTLPRILMTGKKMRCSLSPAWPACWGVRPAPSSPGWARPEHGSLYRPLENTVTL